MKWDSVGVGLSVIVFACFFGYILGWALRNYNGIVLPILSGLVLLVVVWLFGQAQRKERAGD